MTHRAFCAAVLWVVAASLSVSAAEPARDLGAMRVAAGTLVYVRTADGSEIRGRFVRASSQVLVTSSADGRERMLMSEQVRFVWKHGDGVRNGAIIGGLIGLAGGILGQSQCTDCSGEMAIGVGVGVPLWAGIGALVDRQHVGRTLIYRAP